MPSYKRPSLAYSRLFREPGDIDDGSLVESFPHDFLAQIHPLGRMGEVQDIVEAVLYLESAPFVTGEILHVDGGEAAGLG